MSHVLRAAFGSAGAIALLGVVLPAQSVHQQDLAVYEKLKRKELFDAAQRHLQLGSWARKALLVPQATTQFLRAVEVGEGQNTGALTVLSYMRGLGERFWRGNRTKPSRNLLDLYREKHAAIEKKTRYARTQLALRAWTLGLQDEAKTQAKAVLGLGDADLDVDKGGKVKLEGLSLPKALGEWLAEQTITVNAGATRVYESAARRVPALADVAEHATPELVVRTDLGAERAKALHALATALLPHLADHLDGTPTRALGLFVFKTRADYAAYLEALGFPQYAKASGFAEYGTFQTLVCAEGLPDDDLHALVLHELSHLYFFGVAPAAMPDWYAEGFAETFGGQGTFAWDGAKLSVGGVMRRDRLDAMKKQPMALRDLLHGDALQLLATDRDAGLRFYAQAWAFVRFLRTHARPEWRERFEAWEAQCRGQVLGIDPGHKRANPQPAGERFQAAFGKELDAIETAFRAWLAEI
jgi:hypothetical protein